MLAVVETSSAQRRAVMSLINSRSPSPSSSFPTDGSFGAIACPALAAYLSGNPAGSTSAAGEALQTAAARLPYMFAQMASLPSMMEATNAVARVVRCERSSRVVVMACDAGGGPHCFEVDGSDAANKCHWPIQKHLYTLKHYYYFVGLLSPDRESFRCYAIWTMSGLSVGEPIASRICSHIGVELEPATSVADAVACGLPFLFCASDHPPKFVQPRPFTLLADQQ